jgi:hypothetical protein
MADLTFRKVLVVQLTCLPVGRNLLSKNLTIYCDWGDGKGGCGQNIVYICGNPLEKIDYDCKNYFNFSFNPCFDRAN